MNKRADKRRGLVRLGEENEMAVLRKIVLDRRFQRLAGAGALLGCGISLGLWQMGYGWEDLKSGWAATELFLKDRPWCLFAALVLLPGLPVPASALLLLAGTVWRERPLMACGLCLLALALNFTWTYWLAAGPARKWIGKLTEMMGAEIPELPKGDGLRLILLLKLTPGIPLFFQNYLLGVLGVPFWPYLVVSLLCNGLIGVGIVLGGAGIADGNSVRGLTGAFLIAAGAVLIQRARSWLAGRKPGKKNAEP